MNNNFVSNNEEELDSSLSNTQIGTHLLYPPSNLPISLLAPISDDYSQDPPNPPPLNQLNTINNENTEQKNTNSIHEVVNTSIEIDGVHYNSRGYEICGQLNQHSKPCQRIGSCPFHKKENIKTEKTEIDNETNSDDKTKISKPKKEPPIKRGPYKRGWTKEEHILFLNGLQIHGKGAWKEISMIVQTRTPTQIQSHAQKYFLRQKQQVKNKRSIHDISLEDLSNEMSTEPIRVLHNGKHSTLQRPNNFNYPILTQFPPEHLNMTVLNPLHPMVNPSNLAHFQLPYGPSNNWLPQIYPFVMPLSISNMHDERSLGIELNDDREPEQVINLKPLSTQDDLGPKVGEKRMFDSFSIHGYPPQVDEKPTKIMKTAENDFLFSHQ